jgi:hypothetical protein
MESRQVGDLSVPPIDVFGSQSASDGLDITDMLDLPCPRIRIHNKPRSYAMGTRYATRSDIQRLVPTLTVRSKHRSDTAHARLRNVTTR